MFDFKSRLTTTRRASQAQGIKVCVYGGAGAGKTRLCATATPQAPEKTLIISAESGLLSMRDFDIPVVQVDSFSDVEAIYNHLSTQPHDFEWVCLDSISEIAEQCLAHYKAVHVNSKNGWAAYGDLLSAMDTIMKRFRDLPMNVYMSAKMEREKTEDGALLYQPMMPGSKLSSQLPFIFDELFCLHSYAEEGADGPVVHRTLQTFRDSKHEAKDRSGCLEKYEVADLNLIAQKIMAGVHNG